MVDLNKLDIKIDELLKSESSDSLTKWLMNKRMGNINNVLGDGRFVSLKSRSKPIIIRDNKSNFNQKNTDIPADASISKLAS